MKKKLSSKFWLALTLFSLLGQIAWVVENMYLNVFMYKMFNASAGDIAAMVAASAISATVTTVFIGALSDKIGKRKLFISGGYILWGISILCFILLKEEWLSAAFPMVTSAAALGVSLVIVLDCVMTFFGSSANDAAFNAWLTDSTDDGSRGAAEGINAMMPLVAILAVFGGFMFFDLNLPESWSLIFAIIGGAVILVGILGFFIIEEPKIAPTSDPYFKTVIHGFRPSVIKKVPALYFYLIAFIIFNISIQIFMPYLILYYEVSLGMADYVFIMAPAIILASVVTAFWGKVYDKKGFSFSSSLSILWLALGYTLLFFFRDTLPVFLGSLLMMCGYLSGMAVFGAKIRELTPLGNAGRFQGVRIFSQVLIPGLIGPYIGKTVLANAETVTGNDGTVSFVPNANIFLAALLVLAALVLFLLIFSGLIPPKTLSLKTPFEENSETSWETEHPRPQMKRDSFISLTGEWELLLTKGNSLEPLGKIRLPFPPESRLSRIERQLKKGEGYIYRKTLILKKPENEGRLLLHFGAVDQIAEVFCNSTLLGTHTGGYLPFSFDITDTIVEGENLISVKVTDTLDNELPYGKQRRKRGGMWYTPVSGIWQPVWLEEVPKSYISSLSLFTTQNSVKIETKGGLPDKTLTLTLGDEEKTFTYTGDAFELTLESPVLWSPENPHLYPFTLSDGEDTLYSYFALRTVSVEKKNGRPYICLNGEPYFFHGLLDQGYYSDGIYLPASPDGYAFDILKMKEAGFNTLRKHAKVEPAIFYHYCDKFGMIVFQDMVNSGDYSFFVDTLLPTLGKKTGITHKATAKRQELFEKAAEETVSLLKNHPCVCYYTIFNEGWGQYDADGVYERLSVLDKTRIWDTTSGWFNETKSDVKSDHVYFKRLNLMPDENRPLVLSEFGGYSLKLPNHSFNLDKVYGYKFFKDTKKWENALLALYENEVIPMISRGLSAAILTQISDVEDETNGLLTYDRCVFKPGIKEMQALSHGLKAAFAKAVAAGDDNRKD